MIGRALAFGLLNGVSIALLTAPAVMLWFDWRGLVSAAGAFGAGVLAERLTHVPRRASKRFVGIAMCLAGVFAGFVATFAAINTVQPVQWAMIQLAWLLVLALAVALAICAGMLALMDWRAKRDDIRETANNG